MPPQALNYKLLLEKVVHDVDSISQHHAKKVASDLGGWTWQMGARLATLNVLPESWYRFTTMSNAVRNGGKRNAEARRAEHARSRLNSLLTYLTLLDVEVTTPKGDMVLFVDYLQAQLKQINDLNTLNQNQAQEAIERLFDEIYLVFERLTTLPGMSDGILHELKKRIHTAARAFGQPCRIANMQKLAYANLVDGRMECMEYGLDGKGQDQKYYDAVESFQKQEDNDRLDLMRKLEQRKRYEAGLALVEEESDGGTETTDTELERLFAVSFRGDASRDVRPNGVDHFSSDDHQVKAPTAANSKYAVVWRKNEDNKSFFEALDSKRRFQDEVSSTTTDMAYRQAEGGTFTDVSTLSPKQKKSKRRKKLAIDTVAKFLSVVVCFGEALVPVVGLSALALGPLSIPLTLPIAMLVVFSAGIVNYALFGGALRSGLKDILLGKLYKDEHGRELPSVKIKGHRIGSMKNLMRFTAAFCLAAASGYMCLSFASSAVPLISLGTGGLAMAAFVGASCLFGLGMVFYKTYGTFIKSGGFASVKNYLKGQFKGVSIGTKVKNGVKLFVGATLTVAALALVTIYMTGLVANFLANPIPKDKKVQPKKPGLWHMVVAGGINAMALVPNMVFVAKSVFGVTNRVIDGVCDFFKACWKEGPVSALETRTSNMVTRFQRNPVRGMHVAGSAALKVAVTAMVIPNSMGQANKAAGDKLVQALLPGNTCSGINTFAFGAYSAFPLMSDIQKAVEAPPSVRSMAIRAEIECAKRTRKKQGCAFTIKDRHDIYQKAGRITLFSQQGGQDCPAVFDKLSYLQRAEGIQSVLAPVA